MDRLTRRKEDGTAYVLLYSDPSRTADVLRERAKKEIEVIQRLARYEDMEEQGRLIEQKHGKWEPLDSYVCDSDCMWRCSECKVDLYFELGTPLEYEMYYCPNCGAKMELKELEGDHFTDVDKMGKE